MRLGALLMTSHIAAFARCCWPRGGIPPAARRRSRLALTLAEREDISRGIASDSPLREIARATGSRGLHREPGHFSPWWPSGLSRP